MMQGMAGMQGMDMSQMANMQGVVMMPLSQVRKMGYKIQMPGFGPYGKGKGKKGGDGERKDFFATNKAVLNASWNEEEFSTLLGKLAEEQRPLNGVNVATILHRCTKLRHRAAGPTVQYLANAVAAGDFQFRGREIGNSLYGLYCLGEGQEVRALVAALTPKVEDCNEELKSQEVGSSLYGLHHLGPSDEVRRLIRVLTPKVIACTDKLDSQAVGNALYGLQSLGDSDEIRAMIMALIPKVENCSERLNGQAISNSLYGLYGLGDSPAVRAMLEALAPKV